MAVTALELIQSAMSKINMLAAGETPSAEDVDVGIDRLNSLLESFESEDMFSYARVRTVATLPANTTSRTIGPAQQIAVARPTKLLKGTFGRIGAIDYPCYPVSEAEYNAICLKSSIGSVAPAVCFFDGGIPTGNVYFWPTAATSVEMHIISPLPGGTAADSTTSFDFPPGYRRMIENNLAIELAPDFNTAPSALLVAMAASSKRMMKRTNKQIPQLDLDRMVSGRGNSPSDFYGGY